MSYTQIDNILGQPIPYYVVKQLRTRSRKTLGKRDNQALVYTANKSGWVRVVSSVDITGSLAGVPTQEGPTLAQKNVLFGGISAYEKGNIYKQYPYYSSNPETARPGQFDSTYGFRPMPGITSAKIITQGKLGSILVAEIDFKVNTKQQLDLVDILYFKIGYSMLVEWGNTFFYKHKTVDPDNSMAVEDTLQKSEDYAVDPFTGNPSKETLRIQIAKAVKNTEGNYGGMLGVVTNYNFSMNAEGGYDCKIKIMSPGMLAESMRINGIPSLPKVYEQAIENLANVLTKINKTNAENERAKQRQEAEAQAASNQDAYPPCVRDLIGSTLQIKRFSNGVTGATAINDQSSFKDYVFFTNYIYSYQSKGSLKYSCDLSTNRILDKDGNVIAPDLQGVTASEFISRIKNGSLGTRYKIYPLYKYGNVTLGNVVVDTVTKDQFVYDVRYEKLIKYWDSKKKGYNITGNKAKLSIGDGVNSLYIHSPDNLLTVLSARPPLNFFGTSTVDKKFGNFTLTDLMTKGDGKDAIVLYEGEYSIPTDNVQRIISIEYSKYFGNDTLGSVGSVGDRVKIEQNVKAIEQAIFNYISNTDNTYTLDTLAASPSPQTRAEILNIILKSKVNVVVWAGKISTNVNAQTRLIYEQQPVDIDFTIRTDDINLIKDYLPNLSGITGLITPTNQNDQQAQQNATQQAPEQPLQYTTIQAGELAKSEQSMYTSQLEAILRVIQITTISETINNIGVIEDVKKILWTSEKYANTLYNGLFIEGAMMSSQGSILKEVVTEVGSIFSEGKISEDLRDKYINSDLNKLDRYKINLYYGFHRNLLKTSDKNIFNELDKPEYKVKFKELLTSYVIPYYQSKTLIDGGDIHYPTYIPLGLFFMILNHCSFLYDTTDTGVNIPMFYLDFNPGSNVMLSSDFMLTANPYKYVVPFTGNTDSYKKLFDKDLVKGDKIGSGSNSSDLWKLDAVSNYIPDFKYVEQGSTNGTAAYRGKTMNVLVSIDYLLDVIKKHSQRDETNSVYFRPLIEELLSDLGKCLGSYNIFRLAYDDNSNCFYVVDDQVIPGASVYQDNNLQLYNELPLFGSGSIARSLNITTENNSKLGSSAFISANQDVKNQSTLGIDGTSIGNLSLFAVDRYKRVTTGANSNANTTGSNTASDLQQKAVAASRFNEAVNSFYYGGLRSENLIDQAINYYIEAVARTRAKGEDTTIRATMLLPLSVNFSTDGISSMAIYQSFTINDELLPYSYKYGMNQSETRKMGFIITGLEHTIQNNAWTTDVKANMYYVKRLADYKAGVGSLEKAPKWKDIPQALLEGQAGGAGGYSGANVSVAAGSITATPLTFKQAANYIVSGIEGGWWAEKWFKDTALAKKAGWPYDARYNRSGDTLYGLDRKAGAPGTTACDACKRFWNKIDSYDPTNNWSWGYNPPEPLRSELIGYTIEIMEGQFNDFFNLYIKDSSLQSIIKSDGRLFFNFVYLTWNGSGWFEGFSKTVKEAYQKGIRSSEELHIILIKRKISNENVLLGGNSLNSLVTQGGYKVAKLTGINIS